MKADLDRIMAERKLDALLVMGDGSGNKVLHYLTNGAPLERALVVKRQGGPLTLIHGAMERDTAEETGLVLVDRDKTYNRYELLKKHKGDRLAADISSSACARALGVIFPPSIRAISSRRSF